MLQLLIHDQVGVCTCAGQVDYYTSGEYLKLEKDKFVSFTWFGQGEPRQTRVEVTLKKQGGGTLVKLAHRGVGKSQKWLEIGEVYEAQWQKAFENLASVLENGADLRITKRPMLGIYVGEFNLGDCSSIMCSC